MKLFSFLFIAYLFLFSAGNVAADYSLNVTDIAGRKIQFYEPVKHVICSGPGCLRLLVYLQAEDMVAGVDDIEVRRKKYDARPYALANPQLKEKPVFGGFRGQDNPERILSLHPPPQVIFKTYPNMGHDGVELQKKTGIPVVILTDGDLGRNRTDLYQSLRIMGEVVGRQARAEEVISFFEAHGKELEKRTAGISEEDRPRVFVGGVAFKGAQGYQSTEPEYPPFSLINAANVAGNKGGIGKEIQHTAVAKEKILQWDPDFLFVDLSSLQLGEQAGGMYELRTDRAYKSLTAVARGEVYGLLPYNWYSKNYGSILANAYYIGTLLYLEQFENVDPKQKADEIYEFLVGAPVFGHMKRFFNDLAFTRISME
ncbi:MAG: iron ABC transporter substrate-binding protein [Desulfobulbaceae bacterium]|uniref:Iron ABC transporter substrate-binding protein n=1 Tax=Candidatus Desulfobia pelagia TaxID=2841692 RepID=A0A8J6ND67_9BACT|nr:iron ABC transporter substrate-binding protein [Candidatus Desulfobia pelagia]